MAQLLVQVVDVNGLAAGATVVVPHNLESNGVAVAPTLVLANSATSLVVQSVSTTGITVVNPSPLAQSASFRLERGWQPEVDAFTVTPMLYNGSSGSSGSTTKILAQTAAVANFGANTAVQTFYVNVATLPANFLRAGSTIQFRVSGLSNNATGAGLNTTLAFFVDTDGIAPGVAIATTNSVPNIPNASQFCLTATSTIKAAGANVGALGGVSGSFGSGATGLNLGTSSETANGIDTTIPLTLAMGVTFSAANAGNNFTISEFEIYVTR